MSLKSQVKDFDLQGLYSYLEAYFSNSPNQYLDLKSFGQALKENWCFDANIPIGKGLGSSGALCAAIFDQFKTVDNLNEESLRAYLGEIESYFHVSSSGIDPLISLNQKSYLIDKNRNLEEFDTVLESYTALDNAGITVYLLDTGVSRQASPFVKIFTKKFEDPKFKDYLESEYLPVNEKCIQSFIDKDASEFKKAIESLSALQSHIFPEMFLKDVYEHSKIIHEQNLGRMKLCGAGGGGFYILFSFVGDEIKKYFPNYSILKLKDYL